MSPEVAHRVSSSQRFNSGAIGGIADILRSPVSHPGDVNDPICDISAQFLLSCTAAFFRNGVIMCGPEPEEEAP
jgi:hypothetical protein